MIDHTRPITANEINYLLGYNDFFDGEPRESLCGLFASGSQPAKEWLQGWDAAETEVRSWKQNPTGAELVSEVRVG